MRDFARFATQIGPTVFNPVDEQDLADNLASIRSRIREGLQADLCMVEGSQLVSCTEAVLDSVYNTPRRGEVWDAVLRKCEGMPALHTRPTTSRIPTLAIFVSGRAMMPIGTTIQIWEENAAWDLTLELAVTCSTVTTIGNGRYGWSQIVDHHVTTKRFSPAEQEQAYLPRQARIST